MRRALNFDERSSPAPEEDANHEWCNVCGGIVERAVADPSDPGTFLTPSGWRFLSR